MMKESDYMIDICENCYEEANLVKMQGMHVCKTCVSDMSSSAEPESMLLDDDLEGFVMSDDDVVGMFRDEYVGY
jgi:hypothetical protein